MQGLLCVSEHATTELHSQSLVVLRQDLAVWLRLAV
jgi:hypothetical protein